MLGIPSTTVASDVERSADFSAGHRMQITHLSSSYLPIVPNIKSDAVCGTMEPDRPRCPSGVGGRCLAGFPDCLFRELLRVTELFDHKIRILKRGIAQAKAELESWGDIFLVRAIISISGHEDKNIRRTASNQR